MLKLFGAKKKKTGSSSTSEPQQPDVIKIGVYGRSGVGKSSTIIRMISGGARFPEEYDPTIEGVYHMQDTVDDVVYSLDIMDFAGQDDYAAMRDAWLRSTKAVVFVYDVTNHDSLEDLKEWCKQLFVIHASQLDSLAIVVTANKCDLAAKRRAVQSSEGLKFAEAIAKNGVRCSFLEMSALLYIGVNDCFHEVVRLLHGASGNLHSYKPVCDWDAFGVKQKPSATMCSAATASLPPPSFDEATSGRPIASATVKSVESDSELKTEVKALHSKIDHMQATIDAMREQITALTSAVEKLSQS